MTTAENAAADIISIINCLEKADFDQLCVILRDHKIYLNTSYPTIGWHDDKHTLLQVDSYPLENKIFLIKEIRAITGFGLVAAKNLAESPLPFKINVMMTHHYAMERKNLWKTRNVESTIIFF